jgi:hypothetical protein
VLLNRANWQRVKLHRTYTVPELAKCCGVHKNTIRNWMANGLEPIGSGRPILFDGATVRAFLAKHKASRKRPCPPGTFYCFRCREPRRPALGMVEMIAGNAQTGNLQALCGECDTLMHRRVQLAAIPDVMPKLDVQIREACLRL